MTRIKLLQDPFYMKFHNSLRNDEYFINSDFFQNKIDDNIDAPSINMMAMA